MESSNKIGFLTVDSIRPDNLRDMHLKAMEEDKLWLESYSHEMSESHCPLCDTEDSQLLYKAFDGSVYRKCAICNTLFLSPRYPERIYKEYYKRSKNMKFFAEMIFQKSEESRMNNIYKPRLEYLLNFINRDKRGGYLEIGAGSGIFAKLISNTGIFTECTVIEPSPHLARSCREKGLSVIENRIEDIGLLLHGYNVIACFELLEHIFRPREFISKIYQLIDKDALFVLTTPNGQGFDILELGGNSTTLGFTHINLFNTLSIRSLLTSVGFNVLNVLTPGRLDVDLVRQGYSKNNNHLGNSWVKHFVMNESEDNLRLFQEFIVNTNQSSHMMVIAQK